MRVSLKEFLRENSDCWAEAYIAVLVLGAAIYYNGALGILYGMMAILYWSIIPAFIIGTVYLVRSGVRKYRKCAA